MSEELNNTVAAVESAVGDRVRRIEYATLGHVGMTRLEKLALTLVCVLVLLLSMAGYFWFQNRVELAHAQGFSDATKDKAKDSNARIEKSDDATKEALAAIRAEIQGIRNAQQAQKIIEREVPATTGQTAQVQKQDLPAATQQKLPDSPSYTVRTEAGEIALAKSADEFKACRESLNNCTVKVTELTGQLKDANANAAMWENKAKGGSAWQRTGKVLLLGGCGGAGAATGQQVGKSGMAAATGAITGVVGCALLLAKH